MKRIYFYWLFILLTLCPLNACIGQRFSFLLEGGFMRTQIDGDKLQGFNKSGYNFGFGTNFLLDNSNFLVVKTSYYNQGSVNELRFNNSLTPGVRLEFAFNSIGVELSYKFKPNGGPIFMGAGIVHHRIINYAHRASFNVLKEDFVDLNPELIRPSFTSMKFYYGYGIKNRAGLYLAFEGSLDSFLRESYFNINVLKPYAVSLNLFVDLLSSKEIKSKKRKIRPRK